MRVLELYAGIGGVAATGHDVVAAVDHDVYAHEMYSENFPGHPALRLNLVSVKAERLARFAADCWWMSPPCQPFTIRGQRRDVEDRRCESLLHLLEVLQVVRPRAVIVENVPGFEGSIAHVRLKNALQGYHQHELEFSPHHLGIPLARLRFFMVATLAPLPERVIDTVHRPLASILEPEGRPLPANLERFVGAMHIVDAEDASAIVCTFTGAYGHSPVYAGSYLRQHGRVRLFTPREIARLHGFSDSFALHPVLKRAYRQLGNGLSVDVAHSLLSWVERAL